MKYSELSMCGSLESGSLLIRFLVQARRRTNELYHLGRCHEKDFENMKEYSKPLSSTPSSLLTCHSGQTHTQLGSGTCAVWIFVGLGLWAKLVHAGGSSCPSAFGEKRGIPHRKPPLWFSYKTSIAVSGEALLRGLAFGMRGLFNGVGSLQR